jgi:hypothetical protein
VLHESGQLLVLFACVYRCCVYFAVINYPVSVHTAKKSGAGTDANVFLTIFGNQGDTGERPLMFSKTNRNKFEKGNVSEDMNARFVEVTMVDVM